MRKLFVLILLASLHTLHAHAAPNLVMTSLTTSKTAVTTGERFTIVVRVANQGPDAAANVTLYVGTNYEETGMMFVATTAPAGWTCGGSYYGIMQCSAASFAAGAQAELSSVALAPSRVIAGTAFKVTGNVFTTTGGINQDKRETELALTPSSRHAELSIRETPSANPILESTPGTVTFDVRNDGPDEAHNLTVPIRVDFGPTSVAISGAGWQCDDDGLPFWLTVCRRASIAAGTSAPIEVRFTSLAHEGSMYFEGRVIAEENDDAGPGPNLAAVDVSVGSPARWTRILLPVTATDIPGAFGSLWKTEYTLLLREGGVFVPWCEAQPIADPCGGPPVGRQIQTRGFIFQFASSQFLYVRDDASKVSVHARVYDSSRAGETAGAELPLAREDDFTTGTISLVGIPVAAQYRHTLRVYDGDGRGGSRVAIDMYGDSGATPFFSTIATLATPEHTFTLTTALLPAFPAALQLDLGALADTSPYKSLRVDIRPLDQNLRIWGFASITNNDTHHVTVVTP